ncbi:MAG: histidine phosphatase family protein [Deltaproteobacteria bacterium]|nr:histidine phosphatase family protein [Deltaproteobacteria bacterium]
MSTVHFVRHGQGTLDGGRYDRLSELGARQAEMLGKFWAARKVPLDHVYSGTQDRHRQTASIVADHYRRAGLVFPPVMSDERFNEIDSLNILEELIPLLAKENGRFTELMERTRKALQVNAADKILLFDRLMKMVMNAWMEGTCASYGGMSWEEYRSRVLDTHRDLVRCGDGSRVAVFTSGNPIGIYIGKALELTDAKMLQVVHTLFNTNVTSFVLRDSTVTLTTMNDVSHLDKELVTQK